MTAINYRQTAHECLERAKKELDSKDDHRLRYAALELRYTIEAITYDRAVAYKEEIKPEDYKIWQPKKLMDVLHEIDPSIGSSSLTVAIAPDNESDTPAQPMITLGTDKPFTMREIKAHYDALGSALHVPELQHYESGKSTNLPRLRERCQEIVAAMSKVLESKIWNFTLGEFSILESCNRCKRRIQRRMPRDVNQVDGFCFHCRAEYTVTRKDSETVLWSPKTLSISCGSNDCSFIHNLWPDDAKAGTRWECPRCKATWLISLGQVLCLPITPQSSLVGQAAEHL